MKYLYLLAVILLYSSCTKKQSKIELESCQYWGDTTITFCFNQNLDGYPYQLEFITKSGKSIQNKGFLNRNHFGFDSTICYSITESLLPTDIFNKSKRLKSVQWKVFDPVTTKLLSSGQEHVEIRQLLEYLEEQTAGSSNMAWFKKSVNEE